MCGCMENCAAMMTPVDGRGLSPSISPSFSLAMSSPAYANPKVRQLVDFLLPSYAPAIIANFHLHAP